MASRVLLAAIFVLGLASSAAAQDAVFLAKNVVAKWADCPVKTPKSWDPKVFDASIDNLAGILDFTSTLSDACQAKLASLNSCATDNESPGTADDFNAKLTGASAASTGPTSLSTVDGCCLKECADSIQAAIKAGCFKELESSLCGKPEATKYQAGLFNAGIRCANYKASCPAVAAKPAAPAAKPAAPAAKPAAALPNATGIAAATTAAVTGAATTVAAAVSPAPAASPAPAPKSSAASASASAVMALAGAAALLAL